MEGDDDRMSRTRAYLSCLSSSTAGTMIEKILDSYLSVTDDAFFCQTYSQLTFQFSLHFVVIPAQSFFTLGNLLTCLSGRIVGLHLRFLAAVPTFPLSTSLSLSCPSTVD